MIIVEDRQFDELLARAVPEIMKEEDRALSDASPVQVPDALREQVLAKAEVYSAERLAETILTAAGERGVSREELLSVAAEKGERVDELLAGHGDPRRVGAAALARVLERVGVDPRLIREQLAQAVAQFVTVYPKQKRSLLMRAFAAASGRDTEPQRPDRDPEKARRAGTAFADEVVAVWNESTQTPGTDTT